MWLNKNTFEKKNAEMKKSSSRSGATVPGSDSSRQPKHFLFVLSFFKIGVQVLKMYVRCIDFLCHYK